jgi:hypothetical protein
VSGLALLSLRRALPVGFALALLALLILAARHGWGASPEVLAALGDEASGRAAARQGAWILGTLVVVPFLVSRAAAAAVRWRETDAAWLTTRAASPLRCLGATLLGPWLAAIALLLACLAAAEVAAGGDAPGLRFVRDVDHGPLRLLAEERDASCALLGVEAQDLGPRAVLRARPALLGQPSARVRAVVRAGDTVLGESEARLTSRQALDVTCSTPGTGPLTLSLERPDRGASLVLPHGSLRLLRGGARERAGSLSLCADLMLALAAMSALALGLGAWMRASLAVVAVLCLWIPAWAWGLGAGWLPGAGLFRSLALLGEGIAPAWPDARSLCGALVLVLLGVLLARRGLRGGVRA